MRGFKPSGYIVCRTNNVARVGPLPWWIDQYDKINDPLIKLLKGYLRHKWHLFAARRFSYSLADITAPVEALSIHVCGWPPQSCL